MPFDRSSLIALRELIADTDLTLELIPDLPQNRTAHCRENLRAALALADDLLKQQRMTPAAVMGHRPTSWMPTSSSVPGGPAKPWSPATPPISSESLLNCRW